MSRQMTCPYCGGLHSPDKCKIPEKEKTRRHKQDDLADRMEDELLSPEALEVVEAVVGGAEIELKYDGSWKMWEITMPPTEDKHCPTCEGRGETYGAVPNWRKKRPCPTCHGTGKEA